VQNQSKLSVRLGGGTFKPRVVDMQSLAFVFCISIANVSIFQ